MAQVLYDLQQILSESDFETVEGFIVMYSHLHPDKAGQIEIAFQLFIENLERRYNRKFSHCHDVLKVNLDDFELQVIEQGLHRPHTSLLDIPEFTMDSDQNWQDRSPPSQSRRNKGKAFRRFSP